MIVDEDGDVVASFSTNEFGVEEDSSGTRTDLNFMTYVGGLGVRKDPSGLLYMRQRYYDPELGRWLSADPIGFSGGLNLYGYCGQNPISFVDPLGLDPIYLPGTKKGLKHYDSGYPGADHSQDNAFDKAFKAHKGNVRLSGPSDSYNCLWWALNEKKLIKHKKAWLGDLSGVEGGAGLKSSGTASPEDYFAAASGSGGPLKPVPMNDIQKGDLVLLMSRDEFGRPFMAHIGVATAPASTKGDPGTCRMTGKLGTNGVYNSTLEDQAIVTEKAGDKIFKLEVYRVK